MSDPFVPVNPLELALQKAATDPASRPYFMRELMQSKVLIVPVGERPQIIDGVVSADSQIRIANIEFEGRQYVPFFTSEARLPAGAEYLMLDARMLFEITRGANLIMNPGAAFGKEFFPDEVARLLDGSIFEPRERHVVAKDTPILIGQPKDYPRDLVAALARLYSRIPEVRRAWVAFYHNPERDPEGGLLLALDTASVGDMERVSGESGIVIESVPKPQKFVDLIRFDGTGVSEYFSKQKPFYERSAIKRLWQKLKG